MLLSRSAAERTEVFDQPVRMLVIDDDPILRELALARLPNPGGATLVAVDGEDAWEILEREEPFDLALCDLDMPRLDGFGLLGRVRASARHANLPVVVITSRDDIFAIDRAYELGATSFVSKPVNWRLLAHQLRYVLRSSRLEAVFRASRDEATRAAALKNSLLTLLQHETRTPLHAIIGYSELLRTSLVEPADLRDHVDQVLAAAQHLNSVLGRIFYLSQLTAGTLALDFETVPLSHLAEETARAKAPAAAAAKVTIEIRNRCPGAIAIRCDVHHLSKALHELLANALAHAPPGSAVEIALGGSVGGEAVIEITDRGPGLGENALRRCREPFAQDENPLTRSAGGLGLGLATAQRAIALHGGRLDLDSVPGTCTSARITLPCVPGALSAAAA